MKNFLFGLIATVLLLLSDSSYAQSQAKAKWPFGCRTWTIGINEGIFSMTSEVTLCCSPANWLSPPITCVEMGKTATGNVYQYILIDEIETKTNQKIEGSMIEISSSKLIEEDGINYQLKKDNYRIEKNEKNQRFVKVLFVKV